MEKHQQSIADSTGNAKRMFDETYSESLDAKVQDLKRSFENLYGTILSSDALGGGTTFLTGIITGIDNIIQKFGLLPPLIVTIGTLMLSTSKSFGLFIEKTKSMIFSIADGTTTLGKEMGKAFNIVRDSSTGAILKVNALGMSFDVVKIKAMAMQTALSLGLSVIIAGIVSLISKLVNASAELQNFNDSYANSAETGMASKITDVEKLIESYKKLSSELSTLEQGTNDYNLKEQELVNVQSQIIDLYPEANSLIEENANKKRLNIEATEELIGKEKELYKAKANEVIRKNNVHDASDINNVLDKYAEAQERLKKINEAKANGENLITLDGNVLKTTQALKVAMKDYEKYDSTLKALLPAVKLLEESNPKLAGSYDLIAKSLGVATEELNKNTQAQQDNIITPSENPRSKSEVLQSATQEIEIKTVISDETKSELIALFPEYAEIFVGANISEAKSKIKELQDIEIEAKVKADGLSQLEQFLTSIGMGASNSKKIIDDFNKSVEDGVSISQSLQQSYGNIYSDSINDIKTLIDMQKELNEQNKLTPNIIDKIVTKYPEMMDSMGSVGELQKAISQSIKSQEDIAKQSYTNMMASSESFFKNNIKNSQSWVNSQKNVNQILMNMHNIMLSTNAKNYNGYFKTLADAYSTDMNNAKTVAQSKIAIETNLLKAMTEAWAKYYETQRVSQQIQASGMDNWISQAPGGSEYLESLKQQAIAEKQKAEALQKAYEEAKNALNGFDFKIPTIGGGTVGTGGSSGSGSSGSSTEVEDYNAQIDRYRQLQIELEKINRLLELNKIQSQNAYGEDKIKLEKERLSLLEKQKVALENLNKERIKERDSLVASIKNQGGTFNSSGTLTNYKSLLESLTASANKLSGDAKKNAIERVKALEEQIKKLDELNGSIGDTKNEIEDIKNAAIDSQKEISDTLKDQWQKDTDKLKDELQKRKDAYNKQNDEDEFEDNKFEAQRKLQELQKKRDEALRTGNMSLVNSIDEQIREAQKSLNDLIKDKEIDNSNNRFDEEMDKLDKDLETKINEMEKALQDGKLMEYIDKNGLKLTSMFMSVEDASGSLNKSLLSVGTSIDTWTERLNVFKNNLASIQTNLGLNINSNMSRIGTPNGVTVNSPLISLTIEGGDVSDVTLSKVETMLDEYSSNILEQFGNIYK